MLILTWHKKLKEQGLDILEGHVLAHVCQVVTSFGDSYKIEKREINLAL